MDYSVRGSKINHDINTFQKEIRGIEVAVFKTELALDPMLVKNDKTVIDEMFIVQDSLRDIITQKKREYIKANPDNDFSAYLLTFSGHDLIGDYLNTISFEVRNGIFKKYLSLIGNKYKNHIVSEASKNIKPGALSPDFTLKDFHGNNFLLSKLRGKFIVLDFWASWCSPCIKGIPMMKEYYNKYKDKVEFVSIACNDKEDKSTSVINKNDIQWIQLFNNDSEVPNVSSLYSAQSLPTKIIIDQKGNIVSVYKGEVEEFYKKLDEILNGEVTH